MSWSTQCVGRVLMQFPDQGKGTWSAEFDDAEVKRLWHPMSRDQFWVGVDKVKQAYATQAHDENPNRIAHYQAVGDNAAFLAYYNNDASLWGPYLRRFVWLDAEHAYEFTQGALPIRGQKPTTALFAPFVDKYTPIFQRIQSLSNRQIPSEPGFCVDGALITGDTGRNAKAGFTAEIIRGIRLVVAYRENIYKSELYTGFGHLTFERQRAELSRKHLETAFKEFSVLRKQERTLDGLLGQEFITRTIDQYGVKSYLFWWNVRGSNDGGISKPSIAIHMTTPTTAIEATSQQPYPSLPAENQIISAWDHALSTFKVRPGSMPAGQRIEAFNDDDGLTPWHAPQ